MRALVIVCLLLTAATAAADNYTVTVPQGWAEQPAEMLDAQLTRLRAIKGTKSVEAKIYMSPDNTTQLTVMHWLIALGHPIDQSSLIQLDTGMVKGSAKVVTTHVSDERHFEGQRMVGTAVDQLDDNVISQTRLYVADRDQVVHMLNVVCTGPAKVADCEQAQTTMQFDVPDAITVPVEADDEDSAYRLGKLVGSVLGVLAVVGLVIWLRRRV